MSLSINKIQEDGVGNDKHKSVNIRKSISSIRSFNTKVTTEPRNCRECSAWLAKASYVDKTFVR